MDGEISTSFEKIFSKSGFVLLTFEGRTLYNEFIIKKGRAYIMISQENYNKLLEGFWDVASWAMWLPPVADRPKSNVGNLKIFKDPELLTKINTGFVFVGLNGSGKHDDYLDLNNAWFNFHSDSPRGHDYKLRYATYGTPLWGSYITDIIKYHQEVDSNKVVKYVRNHPEVLRANIEAFREELRLLGGHPVLVALGGATYDFLTETLGHEYKIVKIKHYSYTIGKEKYREELLEALSHMW